MSIMNTLIVRSGVILQDVSVPTINIVLIFGILTLSITILRANEISFKFKDIIEIFLKNS